MTDSTSVDTPEASPSRLARLKVPLGLALGPLAFLLLALVEAPAPMPAAAWQVVALTAWMAIWWVLEPVPIAVTALLPVAVLPLMGVAPIDQVAAPYANPLIFLFLGGFLLAEAIQRWSLHRRIAMLVLRVSGLRPDRLVGGFMVATAALSMWVSNTATAALMVPIGISVLSMLEREGGEGASHHMALTLLLGIALAANIGGMGTLIGTPPNALLAGFMADNYDIEIGFAQWMLVAVPPALLLLVLAWWLLTRWIYPVSHDELPGVAEMLREQAEDLGRMSRPEQRVAAVFALVALAWVTRPLLLSVPVAMAASCAFMLPVATPPNAVVFGSGRLSVAEMMRAGALVGLAAVLVITLVVFALAMPVLGFGWSV